MSIKNIAIIGGGAAGFFSAIRVAELAREQNISVSVKIFEASSKYLKKVKISGGGRCNVTHNIFEVRPFCENYPRGKKELLSPMQTFQAKDTVNWFKEKGVVLVAEEDGRMFPVTNKSDTIINCYLEVAESLEVQLMPNHSLEAVTKLDSGELKLSFKNESEFIEDAVLIATGSSPGGYKLAESVGHKISERAPSLFSFKIKDSLIAELPGLSFESSVTLTLPNQKKFKQFGPVLITHWGLSGPAILKLSAWAAREMKRADYKANLTVNWMGKTTQSQLSESLQEIKENEAKSFLKNVYPKILPKRFWLSVLDKFKISHEKQWANVSKKELNLILQTLTESRFEILGQNRFKDEFVECGGVTLSEIDFKTMESKVCKGVFFAGEILDVDGITGGFNFQNAWTTGWLAASGMLGEK